MRRNAITPHWQIYSSDMQQITYELMQAIPVNYFGHAIVREDKSYFVLATDIGPCDHCHSNYKVPVMGLTNFENLSTGFVFPGNIDNVLIGWDSGQYEEVASRFNIANPLMIINKTESIAELFFFSLIHTNAYEIYCTQMHDLENFIFYYRDKANGIIEKCQRSVNHFQDSSIISASHDLVGQQADSLFPVKRYRLRHKESEICLTRAQYKVLEKLAHGHSAKTASIELNCAKTTVDKHLEHIKLNYPLSTYQLINIYWNNRHLGWDKFKV